MTFEVRNQEKLDEILDKDPKVSVYLEPIAAPVVLGLAGFAGSTWIVSMWLAKWWGDVYSESTWFPLTLFFGGLGQFIAGFFGFHARDLLVNVVHILWGSFWISSALLFLLEGWGALPSRPLDEHLPEVASWFIVLTFLTYSCAVSIATRDVVYAAVLFFLATGSAIACCLYASGVGVVRGMRVAAYFWLVSAGLGWSSVVRLERRKTYMHLGTGEFGVLRGKTGVM